MCLGDVIQPENIDWSRVDFQRRNRRTHTDASQFSWALRCWMNLVFSLAVLLVRTADM
jgi:hypothetical protein